MGYIALIHQMTSLIIGLPPIGFIIGGVIYRDMGRFLIHKSRLRNEMYMFPILDFPLRYYFYIHVVY